MLLFEFSLELGFIDFVEGHEKVLVHVFLVIFTSLKTLTTLSALRQILSKLFSHLDNFLKG